MRTIGVLGGIGPQATMDFEARVHCAARRLIPPHLNAGYPPMVVWYCRHPPVVVRADGTPEMPPRPDPRFLDAARKVGALADFLVICSNGAHYFAQDVERAADRPVLSMIDATLAEVRGRGWRTVGVLGMGDPVVYTRPLAELGLACRTVDAPMRDELSAAILACMEGRADDAGVAMRAVDALRAQVVDGVILGCTEIPIMLAGRVDEGDPTLINPTALIAEAAVRHAIG